MMTSSFQKWFDRILGRAPAKPVVAAAPVSVNPDDNERVKIAFYRLDAMTRYLAQTADVPESKRREFRIEARGLAAFLLAQGRVSEAEHDALLAPLGAAVVEG